MPTFVEPRVFWIGLTVGAADGHGLREYLEWTGNTEFIQDVIDANIAGLSDAEIMCSVFAKLCYKSFTTGKNANLKAVRDIENNIKGCFDMGHGSVFEHVMFSFIITDCSRVFTHELVRHRIGTAFSQNSGRYIRLDQIDFVLDPVLEPFRAQIELHLKMTEDLYKSMVEELKLDDLPQFRKKQLTSALRRIAPNGQANEIGFSVNLRSLRHIVEMRTGRHSEWEIRKIFEQVYLQVKEKHPLIFYGAYEEVVDGIIEVKGMKHQPYQVTPLQAIKEASTEALEAELAGRRAVATK